MLNWRRRAKGVASRCFARIGRAALTELGARGNGVASGNRTHRCSSPQRPVLRRRPGGLQVGVDPGDDVGVLGGDVVLLAEVGREVVECQRLAGAPRTAFQRPVRTACFECWPSWNSQ